MKVAIEVRDKSEASALLRAMSDSRVKSFALIMGHLLCLPNDTERRLCLRTVMEHLANVADAPAAPTPTQSTDASVIQPPLASGRL